MLIRSTKPNDCNQLAPLLVELGYEITERELLNRVNIYINSDSCTLLVSETDEGDLSGFIAGHIFPLIHRSGSVGRIMAFIVGEKFQSTGIGSALLENLENWFKENKCLRFEVNSGDHRDAAHQFYQSKGYKIDERRFIKSSAA